MLIKMAEAATSAGLTRIDLGKGREQYKDRFKTGENLLAEGSAERSSVLKLRRRLDGWMRAMERAIRVTCKNAAGQIASVAGSAACKMRQGDVAARER